MPKTPDSQLLNSPLKNARGLGSAHHGVDHWLMQKITAIANLPLILWFIYSIISLYGQGASYELFVKWVGNPLNTTLLIAMFISVFIHAKLGAHVVVEDYVSNPLSQKIKIIGQKLFYAFMILLSIVSVLKIAFMA